MKNIIYILLFLTSGLSQVLNFKTLEASFIQTVTDENGKKLNYKGQIFLHTRNDLALWKYQTPIKKSIFIAQGKVLIIDYDLEQVIRQKLQKEQTSLLYTLKKAKEITPNHYKTQHLGVNYDIMLTKNNITVSYKDHFENHHKIILENPRKNITLPKSIFIPSIPKNYDQIN